MSELVVLRNKIRTIQTIKKITHTMRLVSMSNHTSLRKIESHVLSYVDTIRFLLKKISALCVTSDVNTNVVDGFVKKKHLCIIIGSQKGLCGSFNASLDQPIKDFLHKNNGEPIDVVLIGNQVVTLCKVYSEMNVILEEPFFSYRLIARILQKLTELCVMYQSVTIISNQFKSFFVQEPQKTDLFSFKEEIGCFDTDNFERYILEDTPQEAQKILFDFYIKSQLSYFLYQSLLSEHAARFTAMDSATQNAHKLLDETTIIFNKMRQTKITTEIIELTANF